MWDFHFKSFVTLIPGVEQNKLQCIALFDYCQKSLKRLATAHLTAKFKGQQKLQKIIKKITYCTIFVCDNMSNYLVVR